MEEINDRRYHNKFKKSMIIRKVLSYVVLVKFPIFEVICYELLRRKKDDIAIRKRDLTMIYVCTLAAWLAYINLINSLFGGIYCVMYHIFIILLSPLSVGPQLLRSIRLWGMLEHNKILCQIFDGDDRMNALHVIHEVNSGGEEHSRSTDVHVHINRRNSTREKMTKAKVKVMRMMEFTKLTLVTLSALLVLSLLLLTEREALSYREFDKCFPEPFFVLNAGRVVSLILSFAAFCSTILLRHCNDELGIRKEITRNIVILFMTNLLGFVFRYLDLVEWQAFIYVVQQMMVSFSMIIIPCMDDSSVVTWMKRNSKKFIPGYVRPLPQLTHARGSILLPGKRMSQFEMNESNQREREATMSLDAGLCILLSSNEGIEAFTEHCSREFSVENVKFWLEVNDFHKAVDMIHDTDEKSNIMEDDVINFAKEIFQTFIEEGSDMQINISEAQSKSVQQKLQLDGILKRDLFDNAQREIYALMSRHSYPRFISSKSHASYKAKVAEKGKSSKSMRRKSAVLPR